MYSGKVPVMKHENWSIIKRLMGIVRKVTKIINRVKDYCSRKRLDKWGLSTLLEKHNERLSNGNFQNNGISNYAKHFSIFLLELEIYCQGSFQKLSLLTN